MEFFVIKFCNYHHFQEFTPGNSPRSSTVEAESRSDIDHAHQLTSLSDHTQNLTSLSPAQSSPLLSSLSPNRTITSSTSGQTGSQQEVLEDQAEDRAMGQDRETGQRPDELSSIHDSLILAGRREGGTTELKENATFSPSEEVTVAGCGQLESSWQQTTPNSVTPTPSSQSEVRVQSKTPPPVSLPIGTHQTNYFSSPSRCEFP